MTELSDVSQHVLDPKTWVVPHLAPDVQVGGDGADAAGYAALRPAVVDAAPVQRLLSLAEPLSVNRTVARRIAPAKRWLTPRVWILGEIVAVVLACLTVAWLVGATLPLTMLLAAALTAVAYRSRHQLGVSVHPLPLSKDLSVVFSAVALAVAGDLVTTDALGQSATILAAAGAVVLVVGCVRRQVRPTPRAVVVGDRSGISRAAMRWSDGREVEVVAGALTGSQSADASLGPIVGVPTDAGLEAVPTLLREHGADLVVVTLGAGVSDSEVRRLGWLLEDSNVELVVVDAVGAAAPHRVVPVRLADTTAMRVLPSAPSAPVRFTKDLLDRALGLVLLVASLPVLGVLVLAIRLDSAGPGFFRQIRTGRDGNTFVMYKLRTMTRNADRELDVLLEQNEAFGPLFKMRDDPRVTRVGRLLRRTSLDELPQLINVVRGEMSLVGPRPALPTEVAHYDDVELRRLAVRPGMTGLWQVRGRSDLSWETGMELDLDYSDNWRLRGDASILARTFGAVVRRRGAY